MEKTPSINEILYIAPEAWRETAGLVHQAFRDAPVSSIHEPSPEIAHAYARSWEAVADAQYPGDNTARACALFVARTLAQFHDPDERGELHRQAYRCILSYVVG